VQVKKLGLPDMSWESVSELIKTPRAETSRKLAIVRKISVKKLMRSKDKCLLFLRAALNKRIMSPF
jgi:hypothetical protein